MKIDEKSPLVYEGLLLLSHDNGMPARETADKLEDFDLPEDAVKFAEEELKGLTEQQREDLAIGEQDDMLELGQRCPFAHEIFKQWFELMGA